jgi:hypothetical protein
VLAGLSSDLNKFSEFNVFNVLLFLKALFKVLELLNGLYSQVIY